MAFFLEKFKTRTHIKLEWTYLFCLFRDILGGAFLLTKNPSCFGMLDLVGIV